MMVLRESEIIDSPWARQLMDDECPKEGKNFEDAGAGDNQVNMSCRRVGIAQGRFIS